MARKNRRMEGGVETTMKWKNPPPPPKSVMTRKEFLNSMMGVYEFRVRNYCKKMQYYQESLEKAEKELKAAKEELSKL